MKAMLGIVGLVGCLSVVSAIVVRQAPGETLVGDLTGDGQVDFTDFLLLARNFGKSADNLLSSGHIETICAASNNIKGSNLPFVIEIHQSHWGSELWYHVGQVDATFSDIDWRESRRYDRGCSPQCDFDGNTVVEVHQGHNDNDLWYRVGIVHIEKRIIDWGESVQYDRGQTPTVAVRGSYVVEVHRSYKGQNVWYKMGIIDRALG